MDTSRLRDVRGLSRDQYRTWCQAHDLLRDAPEECVWQSGTTVRTHDDEVNLPVLGGLNNLLKRHATHEDRIACKASRLYTLLTGLYLLPRRGFYLGQVGVQIHLNHDGDVHDMQQRQARMENRGKLQGII
jgi:hypothetical protein